MNQIHHCEKGQSPPLLPHFLNRDVCHHAVQLVDVEAIVEVVALTF